MKKKLLLLVPMLILGASCGNTENPTPVTPCNHIDINPADHKCDNCGVTLSQHTDADENKYCDICGEYMGGGGGAECEDEECQAEKIASSTESNYKYPFYLKVGDSKTVTISPKDSTVEEQKHFTWENLSQGNLQLDVNPNKDSEVKVTGLASSNSAFASFKAINSFTPSITRTFNAKVVDFNDNMYLWECVDKNNKVDRTPFGYSSSNKVGNKTGVAKLGNWDWEFERSEANALNSYYGAIGFGKSNLPENLTLKATNSRRIKSIVVEHASRNNQATLTLSIGETKIKSVSSPKISYEKLTYSSFDCKDTAGDIKLSFETPAYDPIEEATNESYLAPGATYLKSILVTYSDEVVSEIRISDKSEHQTVFLDWNSFTTENLIVEKVTDSGVYEIPRESLVITEPDFNLDPDQATVDIEYKANGSTFETSYDVYKASKIEIDETTSPNYVDYVEYANFNSEGLVVNALNEDETVKFDITSKLSWCETSKFNPETAKAENLYLNEGATSVTGFIKEAVGFNTVTVGINPVYEVTSMGFDETSKPKTTTYLEGTTFSYSGVIVLGYGDNLDAQPSKISNKLKWYDGQSYENNPEDPSLWTEVLLAGSNYVAGVLPDHDCEAIKVEGLTVIPVDHFKVEGTPAITEYGVGDKFNPSGLTINAFGDDEELGSVKVDNKNFTWYDGISYDTESGEPTEKLALGTTYVIGKYKDTDKIVKIEGITVVNQSTPLYAVKSLKDLKANDKIIISSVDDGVFINLKETSANKYTSSISADLSEDTIDVSNNVIDSLFTVEIIDSESNKFALSLKDGNKTKYLCIGSSGITATKNDYGNNILTFTFDEDGGVKVSGIYYKDSGQTQIPKNIITKDKKFTVSDNTECVLKMFKS